MPFRRAVCPPIASTSRSTSWTWAGEKSRASFNNVSEMLDRYVASWLAVYKDVCDAIYYRHEQSTQALEQRMSCLNDRLKELRVLSDELVMPSPQLIDQASAEDRRAGPHRSLLSVANVTSIRPCRTSRSPSSASN